MEKILNAYRHEPLFPPEQGLVPYSCADAASLDNIKNTKAPCGKGAPRSGGKRGITSRRLSKEHSTGRPDGNISGHASRASRWQARCRVARFPRVALGIVISGSAKIPHQFENWIRDDKDAATSCHFESSAHAGEKSLFEKERIFFPFFLFLAKERMGEERKSNPKGASLCGRAACGGGSDGGRVIPAPTYMIRAQFRECRGRRSRSKSQISPRFGCKCAPGAFA